MPRGGMVRFVVVRMRSESLAASGSWKFVLFDKSGGHIELSVGIVRPLISEISVPKKNTALCIVVLGGQFVSRERITREICGF